MALRVFMQTTKTTTSMKHINDITMLTCKADGVKSAIVAQLVEHQTRYSKVAAVVPAQQQVIFSSTFTPSYLHNNCF